MAETKKYYRPVTNQDRTYYAQRLLDRQDRPLGLTVYDHTAPATNIRLYASLGCIVPPQAYGLNKIVPENGIDKIIAGYEARQDELVVRSVWHNPDMLREILDTVARTIQGVDIALSFPTYDASGRRGKNLIVPI